MDKVFTAIEDAVAKAGWTSDEELDNFLEHLHKTLREDTRQKILGWRANRRQDRLEKAGKI